MPAPKKSMRPKARSSAPKKSMRPKARGKTIGASPSGGTRGIDPKENYSAEDFKKLVGKKAKGGKMEMVEKDGKKVPAFAADGVGKMAYGGKAKVKKMKDGGMCRGMGAATRGGNYKMG